MRAIVLAAGRGQRMGELTAKTPKPLLKIAGRYLIEYSLMALAQHGVEEVVINICYGREQIKSALGDGHRYGVNLHYSEEPVALETGGGIYQALPLLGKDPFIVLSSDVITHFPLARLPREPEGLGHIVLVDNPPYHLTGDFALMNHRVYLTGDSLLTFSNISILRPELFDGYRPGYFRLGDVLKKAVAEGKITGEYYQGLWFNVGTPEDLSQASTVLESSQVFSS